MNRFAAAQAVTLMQFFAPWRLSVPFALMQLLSPLLLPLPLQS
jgi:hypothetical protein